MISNIESGRAQEAFRACEPRPENERSIREPVCRHLAASQNAWLSLYATDAVSFRKIVKILRNLVISDRLAGQLGSATIEVVPLTQSERIWRRLAANRADRIEIRRCSQPRDVQSGGFIRITPGLLDSARGSYWSAAWRVFPSWEWCPRA